MGWTVLYIAFGVVALWLLGEVLLQYKARLRWRLLAFGGFLGVVIGVLMSSVVVIGLGAIAFAIGQTYVTLSFRRGFSTGWAIGGSPGASRRRRAGSSEGPREPALEVSAVEETALSFASMDTTAQPQAFYEPLPMPDETGQYGVYSDAAYEALNAEQGNDQNQRQDQPQGQYDGAFDPYYAQQPGGQDTPAGQYDYGSGQQQYAAYSDPYVGGQQYSNYDSFGNEQQFPADPYYAQQPPSDTPPGGVWVPQQRDADEQPPQEEPSPYGYDPGYNEPQQYRY
ncbi:hypothetical protein [Streptomyces albipurpureus]|uniref:Uncharacterized protein n=1 Tax=Streptomyces albipurpureus TaxID=2897419 RepID=A0ABT0UV24_9ACTN|nr:hypothetical protein [Streptomyces sp. CWNU-1]MCM2392428.1 hypothetical protein [Streptomyces sp. CWNU-1]